MKRILGVILATVLSASLNAHAFVDYTYTIHDGLFSITDLCCSDNDSVNHFSDISSPEASDHFYFLDGATLTESIRIEANFDPGFPIFSYVELNATVVNTTDSNFGYEMTISGPRYWNGLTPDDTWNGYLSMTALDGDSSIIISDWAPGLMTMPYSNPIGGIGVHDIILDWNAPGWSDAGGGSFVAFSFIPVDEPYALGMFFFGALGLLLRNRKKRLPA